MHLKSIINFRDSSKAGAGKLKEGIIFRSANPDKVTARDLKKLKEAGISMIIDLRAPEEFNKGKRELDGITRLNMPLDFEKRTRELLFPLLREKNSEHKILEISENLYLEILDASGQVLKEFINSFIQNGGKPVLIHCQAGKDRTGILVALIHLIAETPEEAIIRDFLKSNDEIIPYYRKLLLWQKILRFGFLPMKRLLFIIEVKERNMRSVLERVDTKYGGISGFTVSAGITAEEIDRFRSYIVN